MNQPASLAHTRAVRLSGYLREDPHNPALLADACDAALAAGLHTLARQHMDTAAALGLDPAAWTFRRARSCIAQRQLEDAERLLTQLLAAHDRNPAIAHDLAYVRLLQGAFDASRVLLAPWIDGNEPVEPDMREALQVLWLRAAHRLDDLDAAWEWAERQRAQGLLQPAACGVASLLALDLGRFEDARGLADGALALRPRQAEALVTRGSLALADRNAFRATHLLEQALQANPDDGRTWSALGLCSLQAQDWPAAQVRFERALQAMSAHVGTWHALGWSRLLQQDTQGALDAFRRALDLDRNFAESHGALGLALAVAGQRADAEAHLDVARRLDPSNVTGRYAQALLAGEAADPERLRILADRLLDRPGFGRSTLAEEVRSALAARSGAPPSSRLP